MAILYQSENATLLEAYTEARALMESLATLIPESMRETLPRPEVEVHFKYKPDGEIMLVFLRVKESGD